MVAPFHVIIDKIKSEKSRIKEVYKDFFTLYMGLWMVKNTGLVKSVEFVKQGYKLWMTALLNQQTPQIYKVNILMGPT